ncbi:hypothetical protein PFI31113_04998 [Pandoraea fibrosis]|uniref:Uncharacterized protein n=1 Tax=Pandoraea fibrosis TaxID=1891094 RepID=A0A5E4Z3K8_9BURK|nr:hypothetical protein PFI31113_04998 [Pandoraea fibrosis]
MAPALLLPPPESPLGGLVTPPSPGVLFVGSVGAVGVVLPLSSGTLVLMFTFALPDTFTVKSSFDAPGALIFNELSSLALNDPLPL